MDLFFIEKRLSFYSTMLSVLKRFLGLFPDTVTEKNSKYYSDLAAYYNASRLRTVSSGAALWFSYCAAYAIWQSAVMSDEENNKAVHLRRKIPPQMYKPSGFETAAPTKEQRQEAREAHDMQNTRDANRRMMAEPVLTGYSGFPEN